MRLNKVKLQRLIDAAVAANNKAHKATTALDEYCEQVYGCAPSDVDADGILDVAYGAGGVSNTMSADDFDEQMKLSMKIAPEPRP